MTRQEYIEKMRAMLPQADAALTEKWAYWLEQQGVPYETMMSAFYGVHQQYGGELAGLLYITGPRRYCLHPNEFMLAAEYLYEGGAIEQIDERPSLSAQETAGRKMEISMGGYR